MKRPPGLPVKVPIVVRCLLAGACIALALPPWGWWPLAFVGLALWDRLLAGASWKQRFRRTWLVCATWFFPALLWMFDLTPPGYIAACVAYAAYFGVACALVPPGRARWFAFPGAVVISTACMWTAPFGGVPLANLALTQAGSCAPPCAQLDSPVAQAARLLGPLLVVALVVIGGIALAAAFEKRQKAALIALAVVVGLTALGAAAPRGHDIGDIRMAFVQGGGPQRTRFGNGDAAEVFKRHIDATRAFVHTPVDVIVWPENVVSLDGPLEKSDEFEALQKLAIEKDATIIVGVTENSEDGTLTFKNAAIVINPDGTMGERFDKVRIVPFGEFVPFRGLLESLVGKGGLPTRDAIPGTDIPGPDHGVLHTQSGNFGTVISWETFFDGRARDSIVNGGEILINPTNGASYWLTQVQTQQIASSRLRAIETGRWTAQAAPTGFSALIDPNGHLLDRTNVSEQRVIEAIVPRREGNTLSNIVGPWPMLALSFAAYALAWRLQRRDDPETADSNSHADVDGDDEPVATLADATA